jgi:hypothetical protein
MVKIVKREVIGSSNPIARWGRGLGSAFKGIFAGFIFIIISFVLTYGFANQVKHSETIASLTLQTPEEVEGFEGMVKIQGEPTYSNTMVTPFSEDEALYYTYLEEDYAVREVEKTRTVTEDGQDIRETYVEYEADWETVETYSKWSEFTLGPIAIGTSSAKTKFNTTSFYEATENQEYEATDYYGDVYSQEELVNVVQKIRYTVTGVAAEGQELIVVGSVSGDKIASGEEGTFFISNMTDAELQESQETTEKQMFWIMVVIAWVLMTSGFTMFFGPITHLLNILPGLGDLAKSLLGIVFGLISAVIIFIAFIGFKYWWLILILLLVAGAAIVARKKDK